MVQSVQELLFKLNSRRVRKMRDEIREKHKVTDIETQERRDAREAEQFGEKARISTVLHLLDLKRAGHSPKITEYVISSERPVTARAYVHHGSIVGSAAAMCEAS